MITLTAALFVGGESRRMGADKAGLIYEGEPLWARQLRTLREMAPEKILISARAKPPWCPPEMEAVLDSPPSRGPLSGLAAALKKIRTTHLLVLAVDMPLMTAEHLRWLQRQIQSGCGLLPMRAGKGEPLCAIYPVEAGELAMAHLNGSDVSLTAMVKILQTENILRACHLEPEMMKLYFNANAPNDFSEPNG